MLSHLSSLLSGLFWPCIQLCACLRLSKAPGTPWSVSFSDFFISRHLCLLTVPYYPSHRQWKFITISFQYFPQTQLGSGLNPSEVPGQVTQKASSWARLLDSFLGPGIISTKGLPYLAHLVPAVWCSLLPWSLQVESSHQAWESMWITRWIRIPHTA